MIDFVVGLWNLIGAVINGVQTPADAFILICFVGLIWKLFADALGFNDGPRGPQRPPRSRERF